MESRLPNPFELQQISAYQQWRESVLAGAEKVCPSRLIELRALAAPTRNELQALRENVSAHGFALYRTADGAGVAALRRFARALGLYNHDRAASGAAEVRHLRDTGSAARIREYIPFTNRAINWHTDGYYGGAEKPVQAFVMHCLSPAPVGGENQFLDPRRVYIALREENPAWIRALSEPRALGIPANVIDGRVVRSARYGPVFSVHAGPRPALRMRYTIRKKHVEWGDGNVLIQARERLQRLLEADELDAIRVRLQAGVGVVCTNILHTRAAFEDTAQQRRHVLRARYLDAIVS